MVSSSCTCLIFFKQDFEFKSCVLKKTLGELAPLECRCFQLDYDFLKWSILVLKPSEYYISAKLLWEKVLIENRHKLHVLFILTPYL